MARDLVSAPLLQAEGLTRSFRVRGGLFAGATEIMAVNEVDLAIGRGEAVGVVGESGCGKTTLGRMLLRLIAPTRGRVLFEGQDLERLPSSQLRRLRRRMQMVFQDPYASLDPRREVGAQIADGIVIHDLGRKSSVQGRVHELLALVGLDPTHVSRLPHEFSGGQRQRIAIARALATAPDFVVADEPVSALDVSVQAQVLNLLADLRAQLGLALAFISHDLHVVRHLCERVLVMYLGRVVEEGAVAEVFAAPAHPYTRALIATTPSIRSGARKDRPLISGEAPNALISRSGCPFRPRCIHAAAKCAEVVPALRPFGNARSVACLRADEIAQNRWS
jgi:oligopeptide/dipeptide ABC transporter ATP-binding protein